MKKKKGFTLVELLVVIAILAILVTVSVVGYMGFTKKATESNDISFATQINTVLQANEVVDGKNNTPSDMIAELKDEGIDVTKLTPTTQGYNYVWDLSLNRVFLLDTGKAIIAPSDLTYEKISNLFVFISKQSEIAGWNGYSYYLKDNFEYADDTKTITISAGIDVGANEGTIINYVHTSGDAQTVTIRTNGGNLSINGLSGENGDTILHYNSVNNVDVISVGNHSYHENGIVNQSLKLSKGNLELKNSSVIPTLIVTAANIEDIKISSEANASVGTIVATVESVANVLKTSDKIVVPKTVEIQEIVADEEAAVKGFGTEKSPYVATTYENLEEYVLEESVYIKLLNDISTSDAMLIINLACNIDLNGYTLKIDNTKTYLTLRDGIQINSLNAVNIYNGSIIVTSDTTLHVCGDGVVTLNNVVLENLIKLQKTTNGPTAVIHTQNKEQYTPNLNLNNCTINAPTAAYGITNNATSGDGQNLKLVNTSVTAKYAIYLPANGTYTYENCDITGYVVICGGTTSIIGGTYRLKTANSVSNSSAGGNADSIFDEAEAFTYVKPLSGAPSLFDPITIIDNRSDSYTLISVSIKNAKIGIEAKTTSADTIFGIRYINIGTEGTEMHLPDIQNCESLNDLSILYSYEYFHPEA